ncbi:MAG TPA: glycosyl hydrolase, partial [Cyclobacteriaceae bacterium]|nr:glycosyl hydrolase [Cyclobacteriaceae bacterium]
MMRLTTPLTLALLILSSIALNAQVITDADSVFFQSLSFRNVGPTRGGRATTVQGVTKQPGTFYMGATGGGVWKTEDYGINWRNISDGFFKTPSIGAIKVYQEDPKIIYVGTGSDGIRSNVIIGKGVYKSENAGKTWTHIGLDKAGQIGAVEVHPSNPNIVFVAAQGQPFERNEERGVYRTKDGGKTWDRVLYHSDSVGATDLEFAPNNPNIIYASMWRNERKPWTIISGA